MIYIFYIYAYNVYFDERSSLTQCTFFLPSPNTTRNQEILNKKENLENN